ncbi:NRDE family protein [Azorhizophilus paspali]|uniref:NRDE family protein n=1 Tax=Azorhizophilus paspali TaxID=69963 RepID=A0ABV6SJ47_AZOPA
MPEGLYGLSNAALDTALAKAAPRQGGPGRSLERPHADCLLATLQDRRPAADAELPDTGVGLARERLLSSVFIASPDYGTCSSSVLIVAADGSRQLVERRLGPGGDPLGKGRLELPP